MADACATCGRPRAHKRAHPCDRTVCWACPESATLPALDCDGNELVVDWRARALAAEALHAKAEAEIECRNELRARAIAAESALAAMRERAEMAEALAEEAIASVGGEYYLAKRDMAERLAELRKAGGA